MTLEDRALVSGESKILIGSDVPSRSGVRRYFFVVMASTITVIVFAGFAPSFYLPLERRTAHRARVST
jgi:hypothetical protein